jgi:hypothetical protein
MAYVYNPVTESFEDDGTDASSPTDSDNSETGNDKSYTEISRQTNDDGSYTVLGDDGNYHFYDTNGVQVGISPNERGFEDHSGTGGTESTTTPLPRTPGDPTDPTTPITPTGPTTPTNSNLNPITEFVNRKLGINLTDKELAAIGIGAGGLAGGLGAFKPSVSQSGYQGGIPNLVATRAQTAPMQRAYGQGAMGQKYFTDVNYTAPQNAGIAQAVADAQAQQINQQQQPVQAAHGGLMYAAKGRYLQGTTDGMADKLRTSIDGDQPAALSHGEFVIPADVVSHLGNGNSDAGAKKLYEMMGRVREARTGTKRQGHQINPDKFMPGGLAQAHHYAAGGDVTGTAISSGLTGTESNLSNWAGPYVTNMLGQGAALANQPYQAYTGQMTAGTSPLQQQAFNTAANLQTPAGISQAGTTAGNIANTAQNLAYNPTTTTFGNEQAQQYMNPYLKSALDPQMAELQRQNDIANMNANAKLTQAGGFGGGRQAVMNAENTRNMMQQMNATLGQGYSTAFDKAQAQFNADQARKMQEAQFGANYGLQGLQTGLQAAGMQGQMGTAQNQAQLANLGAQTGLGATQRDIEQQALTAQQNEFNAQRENPYKMVQFQQSLLQGLPLAAQNYNVAQPSALQSILGGTSGLATLLASLGYTIPGAQTTTKPALPG